MDAITAALALLASLANTAPIVADVQAHNVVITDAPQLYPPPLGNLDGGYFRLDPHGQPMVWINPEFESVPVEVLAPALAHELVHADDFLNGRLAPGRGDGCYDNERRAVLVQAAVWRQVEPPDGPPADGSWGPLASWQEATARVAEGPLLDDFILRRWHFSCEPISAPEPPAPRGAE
jgi:hypothetical protein